MTMNSTVRLSDLHDSDNELSSSPKESVVSLRDRFERIGHSDNKMSTSQNSVGRPSSPHRPSTPPVRRTQGPPRPPPPTPEKPKRHSDHFAEVHSIREQTRSVTPVQQTSAAVGPDHPLLKCRSRSDGNLNAIKKEVESEVVSEAACVEEVDGKAAKKEKKDKNKAQSKDNSTDETTNSLTKKRWRMKGASKSTEPKQSPKDPSNRKSSAPTLSQSSPKKEALAPTPESPSSSESGSREGTPKSGRRHSDGIKKKHVRKTESHGESGGGKRNGKNPLRKIMSTTAVASAYHNTVSEDQVVLAHGSPKTGRVVEKERGEAEVVQEAKRIKEAALIAGL